MSNLPELPVEVWQKILRHSMFVPDFLDPASFEGARAFESWFPHTSYSKDDEAAYWEIERHRNVLRLVCQAWNGYCNLPQFQHRFVRMDDIWHRRIGEEAPKMAIRISFRRRWCSACKTCRPARESGVSTLLAQYQPFCCQNIASLDCKRVKIAETMGTTIEKLLECGALQSIKQTKILMASAASYESLTMLSSCTPALNSLDVYIDNAPSQLATFSFSSSTLVSLSLVTRENSAYTRLKWNLPSLRHFRIHPVGPSLTFISTLVIPILQAVGSQLHSLYVGGMAVKDEMPHDIWFLCPVLERLHPGGGLEVAPPISHPIHTVSIHQGSIRRALSQLPTSLISWPNLQKVIVDAQWHQVLPEHRQYIWTRWKDEWRSMGIVLEDAWETRLESYMESNA